MRTGDNAAQQAAPGDVAVRAERLAERVRDAGHVVTLGDAVSESTAAEIIGVSARTLRSWRSEGSGPEHYIVRRALYPLAGIVRFLDEITHTSGSARQIATERDISRHNATLTHRTGRR